MRVLVLVMVLVSGLGCGGGDDDGAGGPDGGGEPEADAGGGDFDEPAAGQFEAFEGRFGTGTPFTGITGSFVDARVQSHDLAMEAGECRLWVHHVEGCSGECVGVGVCDADGECVPFPSPVRAGDVEIAAPGGTVTIDDTEYGYFADQQIDGDLADPGEAVTASAPGGEDAGAFELEAAGVEPIGLDLEDAGGGDEDALRLVDGGDLVVTWEPGDGDRVRLDLMTDNAGHGLPVREWIECESADDGTITVAQALVEAMPDKAYSNVCAGTDCPPSALMRFTEDRKTVGDQDVALRVGFQQYFILVIE